MFFMLTSPFGMPLMTFAVKGDPLKDISELERVKFVMIGGLVVKFDKTGT